MPSLFEIDSPSEQWATFRIYKAAVKFAPIKPTMLWRRLNHPKVNRTKFFEYVKQLVKDQFLKYENGKLVKGPFEEWPPTKVYEIWTRLLREIKKAQGCPDRLALYHKALNEIMVQASKAQSYNSRLAAALATVATELDREDPRELKAWKFAQGMLEDYNMISV